jgi:hypothetical protein
MASRSRRQAPRPITPFAGFLGAPADATARMTQIVSGGANNSSERLYFNNTLLAANPFAGGSPSSDRSWTTATYDVGSTRVGGSLMGAKTDSTVYGEMVTTKIDHTSTSPYECLSWSAMIFSTTVRDADHDGLPDRLEESSGLSSPDDKPLPQLSLMGASPLRKDVFIEVGAMTLMELRPTVVNLARPTTTCRRRCAQTGGDAYKNSPAVNPTGPTGISVHFDVGAGYNSALGPLPEDGNVNEYLVPLVSRVVAKP